MLLTLVLHAIDNDCKGRFHRHNRWQQTRPPSAHRRFQILVRVYLACVCFLRLVGRVTVQDSGGRHWCSDERRY